MYPSERIGDGDCQTRYHPKGRGAVSFARGLPVPLFDELLLQCLHLPNKLRHSLFSQVHRMFCGDRLPNGSRYLCSVQIDTVNSMYIEMLRVATPHHH